MLTKTRMWLTNDFVEINIATQQDAAKIESALQRKNKMNNYVYKSVQLLYSLSLLSSLSLRWWVGVWHECSKTCGRAIKLRAVLCTQISVAIRQIVADEKCGGKKPTAISLCKQTLCWDVQPWSNVSIMISYH